MGKPKPISEIVVRYLPTSLVGTIEIYVGSEDARQWVVNNVGEYGALNRPTIHGDPNRYSLIPSPLYNRDEVFQWIQTMGKGADTLDLDTTAEVDTVPESER
jgi:hypothetical protein